MKLSEFLKENDAYDAFVRNIDKEHEGDATIDNAFTWGTTTEGHNYWSDISSKWYTVKGKEYDIICPFTEPAETGIVQQFDENIAKAKEAKIELQDNINPNHYTDMAISPYEYVTKNELNWEQGNVIKYISRYNNKNGKEESPQPSYQGGRPQGRRRPSSHTPRTTRSFNERHKPIQARHDG